MSMFQPSVKALLQKFGQDPKALNTQELECLRSVRCIENKQGIEFQLTPRGRDILGKWD